MSMWLPCWWRHTVTQTRLPSFSPEALDLGFLLKLSLVVTEPQIVGVLGLVCPASVF